MVGEDNLGDAIEYKALAYTHSSALRRIGGYLFSYYKGFRTIPVKIDRWLSTWG
jgi:hypothetical protein